MRGSVEYKGVLLAPNSDAYRMYKDKEMDKLSKHMKELDDKDRKLKEGTFNKDKAKA